MNVAKHRRPCVVVQPLEKLLHPSNHHASLRTGHACAMRASSNQPQPRTGSIDRMESFIGDSRRRLTQRTHQDAKVRDYRAICALVLHRWSVRITGRTPWSPRRPFGLAVPDVSQGRLILCIDMQDEGVDTRLIEWMNRKACSN